MQRCLYEVTSFQPRYYNFGVDMYAFKINVLNIYIQMLKPMFSIISTLEIHYNFVKS